MADTADDAARRFRAARGCERRLSGVRPPTMAERVAELGRLDRVLDDIQVDLDGPGDWYGDGPILVLERRVAALLGKPAALYFPTGTMAQQIALRCWALRSANPTVALHPQSHPEVHERHALSRVAGLRTAWPTRLSRQFTAQEVRDLDEPFGTLMVELPLREPGFLLPAWDELVAMTEAARARGANVHFDGARLWESTVRLGQDLPTVAGLADSVYVSFYKTLGGLAGAAVAGEADFVTELRAWRHRYGGNVFQQWPAALTALAGIEATLPKISSYVEHAALVAEALGQLPGARVHPAPPHTHQFQLWLPHPAESLNRAALAMAEEERVWFAYGFTDRPPTGMSVAEITVAEPALEWTPEKIVEAGSALLARLH